MKKEKLRLFFSYASSEKSADDAWCKNNAEARGRQARVRLAMVQNSAIKFMSVNKHNKLFNPLKVVRHKTEA